MITPNGGRVRGGQPPWTHPRSKLTQLDRLAIVEALETTSAAELARYYGVHRSTIIRAARAQRGGTKP